MTADRRLAAIRDKVAGRRPPVASTTACTSNEHADLFTLGELANLVRERKNGNVTYYNVNSTSTRPTSASTAARSAPSGPT